MCRLNKNNMSYEQSPKKTGLARETVKWLQSLDLSFYPLNVRRDFSNGYLVAEIFSYYYPSDFPLHSYNKGASLSARQGNWSRIALKLNLHLMKKLVDGTIHCKPGAAELLVQELYTMLTNHSVRDVQRAESDFTDQKYQELLPSLARSTACKAIKNNLKTTEIMAEPDISSNQRKAENLINVSGLVTGHFKVTPNLDQLVTTNLAPSSEGDECFDSLSAADTTSDSFIINESASSLSFAVTVHHGTLSVKEALMAKARGCSTGRRDTASQGGIGPRRFSALATAVCYGHNHKDLVIPRISPNV
ncbi:hypothetical protein PAMP_023095 [Pampus punctatissimus]